MKNKCVKYHYLTEDGHKEEGFMTYRINDSGQVERIEYHDHFVEYRFLPDGNMYEEIAIYDNGDIFKVSYDYDDEGGLIGTVETNKYGEIVAKSYYNWTKPNRVVSIETISYIENLRWFETQYYRKDGQLSFKRGLERFTKYEYDDSGHLIKEIEFYRVDSGEGLIWLSHYWIYNEGGHTVEYSDELGNVCTMGYEYDKDGNWIRMEARVDEGLVGGWTCYGGPFPFINKREKENDNDNF